MVIALHLLSMLVKQSCIVPSILFSLEEHSNTMSFQSALVWSLGYLFSACFYAGAFVIFRKF